MPLTSKEADELKLLEAEQEREDMSELLMLQEEEAAYQEQNAQPSLLDRGIDYAKGKVGEAVRAAGGITMDKVTNAFEDQAKIQAELAFPPLNKETFKETPYFETVGDVAGGIGGFAVTKNYKGAVAGAGLMGAIGRAIDDQIRSFQGTLSPDEESFLSRLESAGESGVVSMLSETIPHIFRPVFDKILSPFKGTMSQRAKEAIKFFRKHGDDVEEVFGRKNVYPFLPSEGTDIQAGSSSAKILDTLHNIVEKSILGGGPITSHKVGAAQVNQKILRKMIDAIDAADLGESELGALLKQTVEQNDAVLNRYINKLYNDVQARVGSLTTTTQGVKIAPNLRTSKTVGIIRMIEPKKLALSIAELSNKVDGIGNTEQGFDVAKKLLTLLKKDNGYVDYETAQLLRSTYSTKLRNLKIEQNTGPITMRLERLIKTIDNSIAQSLKKWDKEAYDTWILAKDYRRLRGELYQNDLILKLIDSASNKSIYSGKDFIDAYLGKGTFDVDKIKKLKAALGKNSPTWKKAKRFITQKLLLESADTGTSQMAIATGRLGKTKGEAIMLNAEKLEKLLLGNGGMGKEVLEEIYTKEEIKTLKGVANAMAISQAKQADGTGGMFIQLTQGGAVLGVGGIKKASTILLLPKFVSWLFLNPTAAKWLTEGLKAAPGTGVAIKSFVRIEAALETLKDREHDARVRSQNRRLQILNK